MKYRKNVKKNKDRGETDRDNETRREPLCVCAEKKLKRKETDTWERTDGQIDRHTARQRESDGQTDRQTDGRDSKVGRENK